eukprot:TRINITY_DN16588_c0_g1_i1.p1 TRINITY_DN16588_c0_g1~~TRINITY_DN16588_c0_g1_i1.p1  ORF type:complete len:264 (+),score=46.45 TRINITY_DN16588_c0_g1_i1:28-819(+)
MFAKPRGGARLWHWASAKLRGPAFGPKPEVHFDTCAFADAISTSSKLLKLLSPMMISVARLRHRLRGSEMMPNLAEQPLMLANWNSADEFLDGAEQAYTGLLAAAWRPPTEPLDEGFREVTSPEVRKWIENARELAQKSDGEHPTVRSLGAVSMRFESLRGPRSLENIRSMEFSSLSNFQKSREELRGPLEHDLFRGSDLTLEVVAVAEVRHAPPRVERRSDRLRLSCAFNLREGIASPFRIVNVEELLSEVRDGEFHDSDVE